MDKRIKKIIKEIAKEENLSEGTVTKVVRTMTDWTRQTLINMDYVAVLWPWFGTFELLESRVDDETKEKIEEYKNRRKSKKNATKEKTDSDKTA